MNTIGRVISILTLASAFTSVSVSPVPVAHASGSQSFTKSSVTVRSTFAYKEQRCSMTGSGVLVAPNVVVTSAHIVFADSAKLAQICPKFYRATPKNLPQLYSAHQMEVWINGRRHKASRAAVPRGYLGIRNRELEKPFDLNPFVYGSRLNDVARVELERPTSVLPQQFVPVEMAEAGVMTILPRSGHPILQIRRNVTLQPHRRCAGTAKLTDHVVTDCKERVPMSMRGAVLALDAQAMPQYAHQLNGVSGAPLYDAAGKVIGVFSGCRWDGDGEVLSSYVTLFGAEAVDLIRGRLRRAILLPLN